MALVKKQSRGTYVSVGILASYIASRMHQTLLSKTATSYYDLRAKNEVLFVSVELTKQYKD
jgi:hypothetical protein